MRIIVLRLLVPGLLFTLTIGSAHAADRPHSIAEALGSFQLEPGLRVEPVAVEPLTASPCALAWDERGRLFVAENRGYPTGSPDGKPLGVIALLEDLDGDGRMDKRVVFADGLSFPNGLMPWRGGFIVTCSPEVLWLADTNGDGRADVRRVLLTGFSTNGTTQLRASHPMLGPDGWIWITCGLSGGTLLSPQHPERPALKTTTDIRFHPETLEVETVEGRGQFGQSFDDYGRRFICMNRVQVQHVVMPSRYFKRNPNLAFSESVQNCPELVPNPFLPGNNGAARLYPISANLTTADSHAGTFTAACGIHIYRGDALPGYRGRAFSCDPTGNLVHWDELIPVGATFSARRSTNRMEFLASRDDWFRPVFLATAPDGALYIADMYRKTIEHPEYLPVEIRKRTDFESGRDLGRIWRVSRIPEPPPGNVPGLPPQPQPPKFDWKEPANWHGVNLASATSEDLCRALQDDNGWRRDTALRLLVERHDLSIVPLLRKQASPAGLQLLEILHCPDDDLILSADGDWYPGGRNPALEMVLELCMARPTNSLRMQEQAVKWIRWDNRIGFLAKCITATLPYEKKRDELLSNPRTFPPLDPGQPPPATSGNDSSHLDRWQRAALLASMSGQAAPFLRDLTFSNTHTRFFVAPEFLFELSRLAALEGSALETKQVAGQLADFARQYDETEQELDRLAELYRRGHPSGIGPRGPRPNTEWELPALHGIMEGLQANVSRQAPVTLSSLVETNSFSALTTVARRSRLALTNSQPLAIQVAAAALLGEIGNASDGSLLLSAFSPESSFELQRAAVRGFLRLDGTNGTSLLLTARPWSSCSPSMRETLLTALFDNPTRLSVLLEAIQAGRIPANAIDAPRRIQVLKHKDGTIRKRAEALFKQPAAGDRMKAYEQSKAALALVPNAANGIEVFRRACANCHRLDREGVAVGPDLFDIRNQPKETILLHIVIPEYEIAPNFAAYTLETKDGRTLTGLVAGETSTSVTLRLALGVEEPVLRENIVSLSASRLSLMPQELEKAMTPQELADLLGYLKGEK